MLRKLQIIWLLLTGKVVGESNEPTNDGYRRSVTIEKTN